MTTITTKPLIGLEAIQREAFYVLFSGFNNALIQVENFMADSDTKFYATTGRTPPPASIDPVIPDNFHEGHRPSLISAPIDAYPNCCAYVMTAVPAPENNLLDHTETYNDLLIVELMVRANPSEGEDIVNRRCVRSLEAAHLAIMSNKTLNGIVSSIDSAPSVERSEVFTRKERTSYGQEWYWQAGKLEYVVTKDSQSPSSSSFDVNYPGIDQL